MIIWCSGNAAKTLPPSAQRARTRLVNLTHTWGFLTSSQMGRKGRLDVFSLRLWPLSLYFSFSPPPLGSNFICRREIIRFKLCSCVKGLTQNRPCYMRPFWQYFEYIYFSTSNIYINILLYANYKLSCNISNRFQAIYVWTLYFWGNFC
jgi:hypothetical protein